MRRSNGTGTVVKLSGTRRRPYAVRIPGRDRHGHVTQEPLGYYHTLAEAQAALDEFNRRKAEGGETPGNKLPVTLQEVYDGWSGRKYPKLKPASVASHRAAWGRVSVLAGRKVRDIGLDDWQRLLDWDEANGLSKSSIQNDAALIRALCKYAMERDIIMKDYSAFLEVPTVGAKYEKGAFDELQLRKLEQLAAEGYPWADTVLMLCYTGFRVREFLGLTRFAYHPEHGGYLQAGQKTEAGKDRIVPVHRKIAPYLGKRLAEGGAWIILADGKKMSYEAYMTAFRRVMAQIGAEGATPHWCRHTFATLLHHSGVDALTSKWLMGHSTKSDITAHYTHQIIADLRAAIDQIA